MAKLTGVPKHSTPLLIKRGVMVIVAVIGAELLFVAVNEGIFPVPVAAKPMAGFELIQL